MFKVPEKYRIKDGPMGTSLLEGNNGAFLLYLPPALGTFVAIVSDGMGWEHVSVSYRTRTPTWEEMCKVKDFFWDAEDPVFQIHPPRSEYVNLHPYCLHLWRPKFENFPRPPRALVG